LIIYTPTYSKHVNVKHHKAIQIVVADASSNHKAASNHSRNHGKGIDIKSALNIQWALLNGILDNVISLDRFSKSGFLKLPLFNGKGRLYNIIIWLLQSETTWQKAIPLELLASLALSPTPFSENIIQVSVAPTICTLATPFTQNTHSINYQIK
jgi:hypothetical protein